MELPKGVHVLWKLRRFLKLQLVEDPSIQSPGLPWPDSWDLENLRLRFFKFFKFFKIFKFFKFSLGFSYFPDFGVHSGKESLRNGFTGVWGLLQPDLQVRTRFQESPGPPWPDSWDLENLRNGPAGVSGLLQPEFQIASVQSPPRPAGLRTEESQAQIFQVWFFIF